MQSSKSWVLSSFFTAYILHIRSIKYCFLRFSLLLLEGNLVYQASRRFPCLKNTIIPQDSSTGEISWAKFTRWWLEKRVSPFCLRDPSLFRRQKGDFTIIKLLTESVRSWLSMISLLAGDIFVKEIMRETARGTEHITFLHLNLLISLLSVFSLITVIKS